MKAVNYKGEILQRGGGGGVSGASFTGGVSTFGNTGGTTGTVSDGIVFVGSNNITLSESKLGGGATISIFGATAGGGGGPAISAAGNSISAGTAVFSNSNNVSFGMAGSTITASATLAETQTVPAIGTTVKSVVSANSVGTVTRFAAEDHGHEGVFAAGVSTGGNTQGNTTVQPGRIVFAGGNNITLSVGTGAGALQTITVVGPATVAQTNQSAIKALGVSNVGSTAGNTGVSTGIDWVIAGSNMVTASESTAGGGPNTIWLNATQTVQAESLSLGVSNVGNTQGNTGVATGQRLVFVGTNNITLNQATGAGSTTISISGNAAQTTQPAVNALGVSNTGTTAGNTGTSSGITWVLAGSGNITASQSTAGGGPNTIWFSVPAQSNQSAVKAFGASNTGNTAGNTGVSTGVDWVLAGSNSITISESTAVGGPNTLWLQMTQAAGAGGIAASASGSSQSGGTVVWSNSNNVSFGMAGSTITATATIAQTAQSAIKAFGASNTGNTAGATGVSTGVDWVIAGSNSITISESTAAGGPNTLWIQMTGGAGGGVAVSASGNSISAGTAVWSNSNNVSFGMNASTITASATFAQTNQSAIKGFGASNTGSTAGNTGISTGIDWVVAGTNMVTISESTAVGGPNTLWVNATQTAQTQDSFSIGVSNLGNTQGNTTVNSGSRFVFVGTNGITISQATGANSTTISISGNAAQTVQPAVNAIGVSNTGTTAGNTGTFSGLSFAFGASGNITASQSTTNATGPHTIWYSVPAQTAQSAIKALGVSNTGNTAGNTGVSTGVDWVVAGSNNITISESTAGGGPNTIWISGANAGAAQFSVGVSNLGNTSNQTGVTGTRIVFAGVNNITLSQNTDATGATITISGGNAAGGATGSYWCNVPFVHGATNFGMNGTIVNVQPFFVPYPISFSYIRFPLSYANMTSTSLALTAGSSSFFVYQTFNVNIYSQGAGANSRSLQHLCSSQGEFTEAYLFSISNAGTNESIAYQITYPTEGANTSNVGTTMLTTAAGASIFLHSTGVMTNFSGIHWLDIPFASSLDQGNYWIALGKKQSTTTSGGAININAQVNKTHTWVGVSQVASNFVPLGMASAGGATASTYQWSLGLGSHTVSAQGATTASLALSSVTSMANFPVIPMWFIRQA